MVQAKMGYDAYRGSHNNQNRTFGICAGVWWDNHPLGGGIYGIIDYDDALWPGKQNLGSTQ